MKLYYMQGACPLATHIVLEWTGAEYESVNMAPDTLKSPEFLAINPLGAVPVLEVEGQTITQNAGVMTYLAEAFPDAKLEGDGTAMSKARVYSWFGFANSDLHRAYKPLYGATAYLGDKAVIEATQAHARTLLRSLFEHVDAQLKGRDWIADHRSIADAYLYVLMRWAPESGVDLSGLDEVARYRAMMAEDAGVQRALAAEGLS